MLDVHTFKTKEQAMNIMWIWYIIEHIKQRFIFENISAQWSYDLPSSDHITVITFLLSFLL